MIDRMTKEEARQLLRDNNLRTTAPRVAVLITLAEAKNPLSHTDVLGRLGETDWDPATIYRNLVKLSESGLISVVSRANGISRYAWSRENHETHQHPHFLCDDCGEVLCLPMDLIPATSENSRWASSVKAATIQLRGECPDCIDEPDAALPTP